MKLATITAVAALALTAVLASDVAADEDWPSHLKITATAKDGELKVVLEGGDGWYVNTEFPGLKVGVDAVDGVTLDKSELGKADARLEGTEHEGKAKRATFAVKFKGSAKPSSGSYKTVVCSEKACSPPFKGTWKTN